MSAYACCDASDRARVRADDEERRAALDALLDHELVPALEDAEDGSFADREG